MSGNQNQERESRARVYAVIRIDAADEDPGSSVTVKEIVWTLDEAVAEVERLNRLQPRNAAGRYIYQATRLIRAGETPSSAAERDGTAASENRDVEGEALVRDLSSR
jgi:hypothetical protein